MHKLIFIMLSLMIPCIVGAKDDYRKANTAWKTEFTVDTHVNVKSANRLGAKHIRLVRETYELAETKFLKFWLLEHDECKFIPLEVRIVESEEELNSRLYFPGEDVYADKPEEGTEIIFGRYYKLTNKLYIVPPYTSQYYWRKNFAHETIHYFFDECGIKFFSGEKEHKVIERFLLKYKRFFY